MANRREFIRNSGLAAGAILTASGCQAGPEPLLLESHEQGAEFLRGGPLVNLARAYKVMAEEGLDGLIVSRPLNLFQYSGYYDHFADRINAPSGFVLLSKDANKPPVLILNQFLYYYSFADSQFEWPGETFLFTGWGSQPSDTVDLSGESVEPAPSPAFTFSSRDEASQREVEAHRLAALEQALRENGASAGPKRAIQKALRFLDIDSGRIGVDDPVISAMLAVMTPDASTVDADHALRRIRLIKSAREISLMKLAARLNAEAALAAAKSARSGATHRELRAIYFDECSKRGNMPMFLQVDSVMSETFNAEFAEGDAFAIDAVSASFHYVGDYGRTIFVGEPSRAMKRATDAIAIGWDAVREYLRPGVRYSEIRQHGRDAIKKAGFDHLVAVTPHSVSLCHTDEPGRDGVGAYWVKDDLVLEENMIISVDMPVLHSGMGGTAHLEALTLITKDGGVQINDIGDRICLV